MATTTFCDIELAQDVEDYRYENQTYNLSKGGVVAIPRHTAAKFVNKWGYADYASKPYEVKDQDYDEILMKVKESDVKRCQVEKSDGEVCGREKPCSYHDEE